MKAIIVDDEPKSRNLLLQLLQLYCKEIDVVATADDADDGLLKIDIHKPDVVFLDVEMPEKSGFDLLREAGVIDFKVVFVTAYNHYSLKAIKFNAFDYLLKPVDLDELKQTVAKLIQSQAPLPARVVNNLLHQTSQHAGKSLQKIALSSVDSIVLIDTADIRYFEALGSATAVHLAGGKKMIASKTLKEFEELLTGQFFFRTHHAYLVNLHHVVKYIKGEGGSVVMDDGTELEVSRRKKTDFLNMLTAYSAK